MTFFLLLVYFALFLLDVARMALPSPLLQVFPPFVLVYFVLLEKHFSNKYGYVLLFATGIILDTVKTEIYGTTGMVMFISILLGKLASQGLEREKRKKIVMIGVIVFAYLII